MKKRLFITCAIILITGITVILIRFHQVKYIVIGEFDFDDYQEYIDEFTVDESLNDVSDVEKAINIAEKVWIEKYGKRIKKQRPYRVLYDRTNEVWLIQGSLPANTAGGVANILISRNTGKILAVWHDK